MSWPDHISPPLVCTASSPCPHARTTQPLVYLVYLQPRAFSELATGEPGVPATCTRRSLSRFFCLPPTIGLPSSASVQRAGSEGATGCVMQNAASFLPCSSYDANKDAFLEGAQAVALSLSPLFSYFEWPAALTSRVAGFRRLTIYWDTLLRGSPSKSVLRPLVLPIQRDHCHRYRGAPLPCGI